MSDFSSYLQSTPNQPTTGFLAKNVVNPIKSAFSGGINQIEQGASQIGSGQGNPLVSGTEGALKIGAGIVGAVASPLAPVIQRPLGAAINAVGNQVSNIPAVQNFSTTPAGQTTARVAGDLSNAGAIAGGILGADKVGTAVTKSQAGASTVAGTTDNGGGGGNIWDKAKGIISGPNKADVAEQNLNNTAAQGVQSATDMANKVGGFKQSLGENFRQGAQDIEDKNPNLSLDLSQDQMSRLNTLKENKSFALPDYLKPNYTPGSLSEIEKGNSISPTQTQDLITQLNKSTFTEKASGLGVDQTKIGLTNEIKQAAQNAFGEDWKNVYSNYSKGVTAVEKLGDIVNLDKDATASDLNKSFGNVLDLAKSPQGKIILQNALNEFKNTSGIDLTNPVENMQKILDAQDALKKAQQPGMMQKIMNPTYLAHLGMRMAIYGTLGTWLRSAMKE